MTDKLDIPTGFTPGGWYAEGNEVRVRLAGADRPAQIVARFAGNNDEALANAAVSALAPTMAARIEQLEAEKAELQQSVIAFCGPWAAQWAEQCGLPSGYLQAGHYDLLASCGARMVDFKRMEP